MIKKKKQKKTKIFIKKKNKNIYIDIKKKTTKYKNTHI